MNSQHQVNQSINDKYTDYFKSHYGYSFNEHDLIQYRQWFSSQWKFIRKKIPIKDKNNILEVGSGFGGFYNFLSDRNKKNYTGLEVDKQAAQTANDYFKTTSFLSTPLEDMSVKKQFDIIFSFEVLEHLSNPLAALNKINELLEPGGTFCGTTPYPFYKNIVADSTHLYVLHPKNWERLFLMNNFTSVQLYPMSFFPYLWRMNKNLNIRIPFYIPFPACISTTLIIAKK